MKSLLAASALAGIAMLAAPASAQVAAEEASDDVRMSIVYGDDAAPDETNPAIPPSENAEPIMETPDTPES